MNNIIRSDSEFISIGFDDPNLETPNPWESAEYFVRRTLFNIIKDSNISDEIFRRFMKNRAKGDQLEPPIQGIDLVIADSKTATDAIDIMAKLGVKLNDSNISDQQYRVYAEELLEEFGLFEGGELTVNRRVSKNLLGK